MSDTPRTDANIEKVYRGAEVTRYVRVDFARQLEREVEALHAELDRRIQEAVKARLWAEAAFDEWMARELPRATGYEIDLCRTVWLAASKADSAGGQSG